MELNQLTRTDQIGAGDLLAVFGQSTSSTRAVAVSALLTLFQSTLSANGGAMPQYAIPSTGFGILINPATAGQDVILMITPTSTLATGTITLPAIQVDGQQVTVTTSQQITTLTVAGNGPGVIGAPTTLTAGGFFRLRYDGVLNTYFRIG